MKALKEKGAPASTPKTNLRPQAYHQRDLEQVCRQSYGARHKFLRCVQHVPDAVSLWIERRYARIETTQELAKWNRDLEGNP